MNYFIKTTLEMSLGPHLYPSHLKGRRGVQCFSICVFRYYYNAS